MKTVLDNLKGKLVVSCQALENEPLHARLLCRGWRWRRRKGGAAAIRANSVVDIEAISSRCLCLLSASSNGITGKRGVFHRHDERGG